MEKREYEITRVDNTENVKEISVNWNGNNYLVINGEHINEGFFSVPNWGVGGELASVLNFSDIIWNADSIGSVLKNKKAACQIAMAIAEVEGTA